jgi:hypothetical protein
VAALSRFVPQWLRTFVATALADLSSPTAG